MSLRVIIMVTFLSLMIEPYLSIFVKSFLYSISNTVKEFLILVLPFIIFFLITNGILKLKSKALGTIVTLITMICLSNFTSTWISYGIAKVLPIQNLQKIEQISPPENSLENLWEYSPPHLLTTNYAIILGLMFSTVLMIFFPEKVKQSIAFNTRVSNLILKKILTPIIPVFITGFLIKLSHNGELEFLLTKYLYVLTSFTLSTVGYLSILYLVLMGKNIRKASNMFPAFMTAFSSMSSAIAMPMLLDAAEKNTERKDITEPIVPYIVNVHLTGDCFFIPMIAIAIMQTNGLPFPCVSDYLLFSLQFIIAKFSVAAIPSGGIIVMLPIIENNLQFNSDMLSLITILYALFDPIITSFNIMGNGSLVILFKKAYVLIFERNKSKAKP